MRLLLLGDVVGKPGRAAVAKLLPRLVREHRVDLAIANGENAAGGLGITPAAATELLEAGVQVLTTGNHVWRQRQVLEFIDTERRLLRPANYPPGAPGQGSGIYRAACGSRVGVINLMGRTFMEPVDCPFRAADREIEGLHGKTDVIVVDIHAEATSEKQAVGWYLDGRVGAIIGTHTHVQTSDERLLPKGSAYITDAGMTGPRDSVLGVEPRKVLDRFLTAMPNRFELASGTIMLNGVLVDLDTETATARSIQRVIECIEAG